MQRSVMGVAGLALAGGVPLPALAQPGQVQLTILHTNDLHSRIDPFPEDGRPHAGKGGMARLATLVRQIREQEPNVLLLDSGDIFQGTPYFNFFGGELEFRLMTQMQYDAATLGNHDFDNGLEGLHRMLPHAGFPFLSANYDFSDTLLRDRFAPYKVFVRDGIRIGVFGLGIKLAGLVSPQLYGQTEYLDPVTTAREMVGVLRGKERCDLVICLSHLGYEYTSATIDDRKLAAEISGIDLILGGHTHTFLPEPTVVSGPDGRQTLINQVGWAGINLGRIDYVFGRQAKRVEGTAWAVLPAGSIVKSSK